VCQCVLSCRTTKLTRLAQESFHFKNPLPPTRVERLVRIVRFVRFRHAPLTCATGRVTYLPPQLCESISAIGSDGVLCRRCAQIHGNEPQISQVVLVARSFVNLRVIVAGMETNHRLVDTGQITQFLSGEASARAKGSENLHTILPILQFERCS